MILVALLLAAVPTEPPAAVPSENLLRGPARCVLRYLEAVRLAGPRAVEVPAAGPVPARERAYAAAQRLTAPRALAEITGGRSRGRIHPLAPWQEAADGRVLERFQLLAVRRAPLGAAVVTVRESFWRPGDDASLAPAVAEYLVARVGGAWRVVARRPGATFDDAEIAAGYVGWFDAPGDAAPPAPADGASASADSR